jgi:hypothetical protein
MDTITTVMIVVAGAVGLIFAILGIMYAVNKFGYYRRGNKTLKYNIQAQGGLKAMKHSSKRQYLDGKR